MIRFLSRWVRAGLNFWPYRRLLRVGPRELAAGKGSAAGGWSLVFVPGWGSNAGVGGPLLEELGAALGGCAGYSAPISGQPRPHEEKVRQVVDCLEKVRRESDRPILIIGHSYGGLLASRALLRLGDAFASVRLVTLNSPFRGPRRGIARMGLMLGWFLRGSPEDPELAFMRPGSSELASLREDLESRRFALRTVMSREDEFLTFESGIIEGCRLAVSGLRGHTGVLVRPRERAALIAALVDDLASDTGKFGATA